MQRSIATVSLSGTLPEKLEAIAAAGFDGVEIFENDLLYYDGSPREIRQMCADLGSPSPCSSRFATSKAAAVTAWRATWSGPSASST
jgi:sugar phosphate isomerase/epimerase